VRNVPVAEGGQNVPRELSVPRNLGHLTVVSRDPREVWEFTDGLWTRPRREAEEAYDRAPQLAPLFVDSIINQPSFEGARHPRISRGVMIGKSGSHRGPAHASPAPVILILGW
jgi:hypothetical protein